MAATLTLGAVRAAWDARDPRFVRLLSQLATQPDPTPETPVRDGAPTFDAWLAYLKSWEFRRLSKQEQKAARVARLQVVEAPTAEVPLPDRLKVHEVIVALWRSDDPLARDALLRAIAEVPLVYGPWRGLKQVFKEAEAANDLEVFGALAARFDAPTGTKSVSGATLGYLSRRAWRHLRRIATQLPAAYADAAVEVLRHYPEGCTLSAAWVFNHILFHGTKRYGRSGFNLSYRPPSPTDLKHRAYPELWQRSPRPLFTLLERAQNDSVRAFAAASLKADFKPALRDVEPAWVARLVGVQSVAVHEFVVWILQNVPKFEQGEFRRLGLHAPVLRLLDSESAVAAKYAADYARTHARDLPTDELVRLFATDHDPVRKLARDLLGERDPRTGVGLAAWGRLLETEHGHAFAAEMLLKAFGAKELTPEWFADRLLSSAQLGQLARDFARANLLKVHPPAKLGPGFFVGVLKRLDPDHADVRVVAWAMVEVGKLGLDAVAVDDLRWLFLSPVTASEFAGLLAAGRTSLRALGLDFLRAVAYRPDWEASPWVAGFKAAHEWAADLDFDEDRAKRVLAAFADVRQFSTADLGLDWLLALAARPEPLYHDFARDRLIRTLAPADFAPQTTAAPLSAPTAVDLAKRSFLFTGKLATMTRDEAEAKVKAVNGTVSGSVTKNLHYLVVGDDGSPLYGAGKKGTKQVKAEQLNEAGANIAVVSETAFLQMLAGTAPATADAGSAVAGTDRLWTMATAPGPADAPLAAFARAYLVAHHTPLAREKTGKAPDPGTEVPAEALTWERFAGLFADTRKPLRDFALQFAATDFARWNPSGDALLALSETPFADVRRFAAKAILAPAGKESAGYRLDATKLEPAAVYRFVESADEETRGLGLELIRRQPRLRVPEELFRLTESPDRAVRAFVIRSLWQAYRERELTEGWKPPEPPAPTVGAKAKADAAKRAAEQGAGVPAPPDRPPASGPTLAEFLRRVLFELPPGPPDRKREEPGEAAAERQVSLKPIPARRAKTDAVTVMRDLALEDAAFAAGVLPLLDEFLRSSGAGERAACLVAVTRIRHTHPTRSRRPKRVEHMDRYHPYRGDLRAAVGVGSRVHFVTAHPDGQPTAVYTLQADADSLSSRNLPCGGVALVAVSEEDLYVAGTDRHIYALRGRHKAAPLGEPLPEPPVALVPVSGDRLAVVAGPSLHLLAIADGRVLQTLPLPAAGTCVAADPTGRWLAVGTAAGEVAVFPGEGDEFEPGEAGRLHDGAVTALLFEADELRFFSGGADGKLLTTHARGGLEPEDKGRGNAHTDALTALVLVPAGDRLVSGSRDGTVKNWPRAGATKPATLSDGVGKVVALARVADDDDKPVVSVLCDDARIRFLPLADDGRFDEDRLDDFPTVHGALAWAKNELASGWNTRGRLAAVKELAAWNDAASLDLLAEQAGTDKDAEVRATATKLLGATASPRAVTLLEPLLDHNDQVVRGAALTGLRSLLGPDDPRPLDLALATGKPEIGVRAVAALEAPARTDDQALAKVVAALAAPTWDVRKRAVAALEVVFEGDPERATLLAVNAAAGDVRALALRRAFERTLLERPAIAAAVRRRLEDDDPAVRHVAFLLSLEARPTLLAAVRSRDPELHRQLAELDKANAPTKAPGKLESADYDVLLQAAASRALDTALRGANALARLGDGRAFPLLLQLSRAEPEAARVEVCRALAALGDHRAVARVRSLLLDPSPAVRDAAYTAVERLSDSPLSAAEAGLTAATEDVRRRGLQTLLAVTKAKPPQTESDTGWGLFARALDDPAAGVRREAFKAAVNQGVGGGAERTLAFTLRSSHADVRREALTEVQAQLGEPWAPPLLLTEFLDDPDPGIRAEAFALLTCKNKELAPLEIALRSRYPDARLLAVDALHKKHTADAQTLLLLAVADPDPGVRAKAVAALVADEARGPLTEALAAEHPDARVAAATALARLGDPAAGPPLRLLAFSGEVAEAYRRDEWRAVVVAALDGLRELGDPADFLRLLALTDSPHEAVRQRAANALKAVAPADGLARVRGLLAHADPAVRLHAAEALAVHGDATTHPLLFAGEKLSALDRLAFLVAAVQPSPAGLAATLDSGDEPARRAALLVHLLLERAGTVGTPDLLLQALSAQAPRVRLAAAGGLEAFHDPAAFAAYVVSAANDRGDDPAWKLTADILDPLAAVLRFAPPLRRWQATHLLGAFADKEPARFRQGWDVFRTRYAADVTAAVAKLKPVRSRLSAAELRELAFGAYVGLVRAGDSPRVRQTALARLAALASDPALATAARPVFTQALGDPNQPVRLQAFDHLKALGLPAAEVGAEALESGHTDLGVKGLELLTGGDSAAGREVLRRVMLSRTDDLAAEAAKLLVKAEGWVPVAAAAVDAVSESLRAEAVGWLAERFDQPTAQEALRKAVGSRYRPVRQAAAFALAGRKDPAAFDPLATLLREAATPAAQERVAEAFAALGDKRAVGVLLDRLEADPTGTADVKILFTAAGAYRDPASADRLLAMATKRKGWRDAALNAVATATGVDQDFPDAPDDLAAFDAALDKQHPRHPTILARLIEACLAGGDLDDRPGLIDEARIARGPAVDPALAAVCGQPDAGLRANAVRSVGWRAKNRGGPVEPLLTALKHKDTTTQFVAAEGLARVGRAEGLPVLLSGIEYVDDVALRERAVLALGELADNRAVDALLKLAAEDGHALQEAAAEAIGHLGKSPRAEEVGKLLERLAKSPQSGVAGRALVGLRHLNTVAGWRLIRSRAKAPNWQLRQAACEQLGYAPDPAGRDVLLAVLRTDDDNDVFEAALTAAGRQFGPDSVEPYYAAVLNDSAGELEIGDAGRTPVDVVCDIGDPLRLLELFPKVPAEAQERIEASLTGRAAVPVEAATAALSHADAATVRLAARLLGGASPPPPAAKTALGEAVGRWWATWQERRTAFDRTGDGDPLDAATATLQSLLWAASRVGAAGDWPADIAAARPDDPHARSVRLDALRTLAASDKPSVKVLEALAADADAEVRTLAAAVLAKRDAKRATATLPDHLSDRPTFARVLAGGVPAGDAMRAAAGKPHHQSVALPAMVAAKDVKTLAAVASDKKAAEPARLGAVEGLGFMADPAAEAELDRLKTDADEDVRKAAWKALRRSKRARKKAVV